MERQMWTDFKAKDWKAVESKIADGFSLFIRMERVTGTAKYH
jgi:hypothetical protein